MRRVYAADQAMLETMAHAQDYDSIAREIHEQQEEGDEEEGEEGGEYNEEQEEEEVEVEVEEYGVEGEEWNDREMTSAYGSGMWRMLGLTRRVVERSTLFSSQTSPSQPVETERRGRWVEDADEMAQEAAHWGASAARSAAPAMDPSSVYDMVDAVEGDRSVDWVEKAREVRGMHVLEAGESMEVLFRQVRDLDRPDVAPGLVRTPLGVGVDKAELRAFLESKFEDSFEWVEDEDVDRVFYVVIAPSPEDEDTEFEQGPDPVQSAAAVRLRRFLLSKGAHVVSTPAPGMPTPPSAAPETVALRSFRYSSRATRDKHLAPHRK
jgi:hypothetical protein